MCNSWRIVPHLLQYYSLMNCRKTLPLAVTINFCCLPQNTNCNGMDLLIYLCICALYRLVFVLKQYQLPEYLYNLFTKVFVPVSFWHNQNKRKWVHFLWLFTALLSCSYFRRLALRGVVALCYQHHQMWWCW